MSVKLKTTLYGLSPKVGGWDIPGDSSTDAWQGNHGNFLNTSSCALTESAEALLAASLPTFDSRRLFSNGQVVPDRLKPKILLKITWDDPKLVDYRTFDDRAPESDPRLDLFYPYVDPVGIPDFGYASVV